MTTLKFNINNRVWVRLTLAGQQVLEEHFAGLRSELEYLDIRSDGVEAPEPDANGYTRFCLWELMHIFGKNTFVGLPLLFDPTEILFDSKDVT